MTVDFAKMQEIFLAAVERRGSDDRQAYLNQACAGDDEMRRQVELLLKAHDEAGSVPGALGGENAPTGAYDLPAERPGTVIGSYKLIEEIGEGGMGTVWMAQQTEPVKRLVALKLIKAGMDSRQVVARFEAERQALALMDHPNIARVFDAGAAPSGRPYFVMELVKGTPITRYCDEHRLSPKERLGLFIQVCSAVQHAHQKGIIHRDLKPSNVLVAPYDGQPVVKVIDFGVAKAAGQPLTEKTLVTGFGAVVGTPEYMSPEQAELNNQDIDTRSDIYSLGVLLYELLTGTTPLTRKRLKEATLLEVLRVIREEEPPRPSTRLSESKDALPSISAQRQTDPAKLARLVRGELDWIVMKALEKDRNRRYETANGLAQDLQRYLADEPVLACPPSVAYRLRKFVRRNKAAVAMVIIVAVALVAVGAVGTLGYWNEQQRLTEQKAHEERLLAEQREHALEKALMAAMIGDFDGGEKAIGEAELLGASTGQVRMLRGYLAFHRGDMEQAIQHLEQAAKLLPPGESGAGAARAMLGLAYYQSPQGSRFEHVFQELETLSPRSLEDYLFKGQVEAIIHPERGLKTLDEAVRRRDSSIIRALRTEARANHALFTGEVRTAELALEDSRVAKAMLPGNPLVLARSVYAHLVAAGIYENADCGADREHVLAQARADVQVLERFPSSPIAARACFEYFDFVGDEKAAYAMSQRGTEFRHVVMLYRRGELAKALEAADRSLKVGGSFNGSFARVERAFVLADLADGPAQARVAFREATAQAERCTYQQLGPPLICLLLGRRDEAVQAFLQVREDQRKIPPWLDGWYYKYLDYHCGLMTADELLQAAGTCPTKLCEAHSLIGLHRLADGDRVGAREHFRKCAATRAFNYWHYVWSRAFLKRLEDDPAWPPWIPLKK